MAAIPRLTRWPVAAPPPLARRRREPARPGSKLKASHRRRGRSMASTLGTVLFLGGQRLGPHVWASGSEQRLLRGAYPLWSRIAAMAASVAERKPWINSVGRQERPLPGEQHPQPHAVHLFGVGRMHDDMCRPFVSRWRPVHTLRRQRRLLCVQPASSSSSRHLATARTTRGRCPGGANHWTRAYMALIRQVR